MFTNWFSAKSADEPSNTHDATLENLYGRSPPENVPLPESVLQDEPIRDPFTGQPLASMLADADPTLCKAEAKSEELWSHLSRILDLQADVANLHLKLESGKPTEKRGDNKRDKRESWARKGKSMVAETMDGYAGGDVGVDDEEDVEITRQKERNQQIQSLADHFVGQREQIDEIMDKVHALSDALATFHALHVPCLQFSNSKNGTLNSPAPEIPSATDISNVNTVLTPTPESTLMTQPSPPPPPPAPSSRPHLFLKTHESAVAPPVDSPLSFASLSDG